MLSCARRQYSLAVGKLGNAAMMGSFPNHVSHMGACDSMTQSLKKPSSAGDELRPMTKGGGSFCTGNAFEAVSGAAGPTSGSASGFRGASCEAGAQSAAGLWNFCDFDSDSDMRAMKFEDASSHAFMSEQTEFILF